MNGGELDVHNNTLQGGARHFENCCSPSQAEKKQRNWYLVRCDCPYANYSLNSLHELFKNTCN